MSTGFFRSTIGSATLTWLEACARLVPRLRLLAIFEGLWSLRGRMVDRVGSRRVGPQFAVHESLRCDAATFIRTGRASVLGARVAAQYWTAASVYCILRRRRLFNGEVHARRKVAHHYVVRVYPLTPIVTMSITLIQRQQETGVPVN